MTYCFFRIQDLGLRICLHVLHLVVSVTIRLCVETCLALGVP